MFHEGVPLNTVDQEGLTALLWAARYNRTDVVRFLLKNGAGKKKQDQYGMTALHYAASEN